MKGKSVVFFILALVASFLAATYRWGDSAHSIGLIKASGGEARHPAYLRSGEGSYALIATATVISPYRGDARVVLEGTPRIDHGIYLSGPIVDLGIRRNPELRDNVIHGLQPEDRIALWVVMKPPTIDPVCGMPYEEGFLLASHEGREYFFCSEACAGAFRDDPGKYKDKDKGTITGRYTLAIYDTKTNRPVLRVPVIFTGKGEASDAGGHQH
jgi:YHS domain-containing protein